MAAAELLLTGARDTSGTGLFFYARETAGMAMTLEGRVHVPERGAGTIAHLPVSAPVLAPGHARVRLQNVIGDDAALAAAERLGIDPDSAQIVDERARVLGEAVALIDWDFLHRAPRLSDVAYALQWFAPVRDDQAALEWHHFPEVPDRRARIEAFLDAYGIAADFDVADAVVRRIRYTSDHVRFLAAQGQEPQRTWVAEGGVEQEKLADIAWVEENRALLSR